MLCIFSGLTMAIIRVFESYSNALKSLCILIFCKKKNQDLTLDETALLDGTNKDSLNITVNNQNNSKTFIDIERKILENVN
jgi:hypothetical protein